MNMAALIRQKYYNSTNGGLRPIWNTPPFLWLHARARDVPLQSTQKKIAWEGNRQIDKRTLRLLHQIGPVGRFGEKKYHCHKRSQFQNQIGQAPLIRDPPPTSFTTLSIFFKGYNFFLFLFFYFFFFNIGRIAKSCHENISSFVEVSSCFYKNTSLLLLSLLLLSLPSLLLLSQILQLSLSLLPLLLLSLLINQLILLKKLCNQIFVTKFFMKFLLQNFITKFTLQNLRYKICFTEFLLQNFCYKIFVHPSTTRGPNFLFIFPTCGRQRPYTVGGR